MHSWVESGPVMSTIGMLAFLMKTDSTAIMSQIQGEGCSCLFVPYQAVLTVVGKTPDRVGTLNESPGFNHSTEFAARLKSGSKYF